MQIFPQELKALFPNASASFLSANHPEHSSPGGDGRRDSVVQESQTRGDQPRDRKTDELYRGEGEAPESGLGGGYSIEFTFLLSDRRRRDGWGMCETVADCLVRAVRRFLEGDAGGRVSLPPRGKRRRGSGN